MLSFLFFLTSFIMPLMPILTSISVMSSTSVMTSASSTPAIWTPPPWETSSNRYKHYH